MKKKSKFRPRRMLIAMVSVVAVVVIWDVVRRMFFLSVDLSDIVDEQGKFADKFNGKPPASIIIDNGDEQAVGAEGIYEDGYKQITVTNADIYKGALVPGTIAKPPVPDEKETEVNLSSYHNDYYGVIGESVVLTKKAADALNKIMEKYANETGIADFIVYGTTETYTGADSPCPRIFPDSSGANTVDLAVFGYDSALSYDGMDTEGWVNENCSNYGYIVRYPYGKDTFTGETYCPWHLRYVGLPHSMIMAASDMCLEEYLKYVQGYTKDSPMECNIGEDRYEIYSVLSNGDVTYISVPDKGEYDISGDGANGYIVTVKK